MCSTAVLTDVSPADVELNTLDERFVKLLAWQRIQQLLEPKVLPVLGDVTSPTVTSLPHPVRPPTGELPHCCSLISTR